MKKLIHTACLLLGLGIILTSNAYAQSDLQIEGGVAYGLEAEAIGIQAGALYNFANNIRGDADFTYFFPDSPEGVDNSLYEINVNGHYLFVAEEATSVYALAGLNYISQEVSGSGSSYNYSYSETGLNIGGGAEFGVGFGGLYIEAKYALSSYDQLALTGGVRFNI